MNKMKSPLVLEVVNDEENKQRKLTQDSGIWDDERKANDDIDHLSDSLKCNCCSSFEDIDSCSPKSTRRSTKKQRRMTPIPLASTSKELPIIPKNKFLFVEEEDADDIGHYNSDDDYIEDIFKLERLTRFSRSWHDSKDSDTGLLETLQNFKKARSLDCVLNLPKRTRRNMYSVTQGLENQFVPEAYELCKETNVPDKVGSSPTCYAYKSQKVEPENFLKVIDSHKPKIMNKELLPLWMQEASENEMSSDTGSIYSGDSESSSDDEDFLCNVLAHDCNKLNDNKNKHNKLLQNQRQLNKANKSQKHKTQKRRKVTPSDTPCTSSLEKLSQLKVVSDEWKVTEEEEEVQEAE